MPASSRILALNLGSQTLGLAEFQAQPDGGMVLNRCGLREVLIDPIADGNRDAQITETLREMLHELELRGGPVNYAISSQAVFARFVKLPPVDQEKIERIITFEAQQNVPFPIEEVVWDYQLVGASGADKIEVVLVAIKSDLLEGLNEAVEKSGLRTRLVDVATMSLYNAFRYNYGDLTGSSLLIDIGARTTNLLFVEPGKVFSRSIPIGGSSITSAIAKEFNESFTAAEARKKRDGFVSLGGVYAEPSDPNVARVSKIMRNTMTRLHAELARSISFYRAQQQGNSPQRVYLCGGTSSTPYTSEFFHEKLQLPIEFFNPLRNVVVTHNVMGEQVARSAHLLGELVGLALRNITTCPMELNLRPAGVVRTQKFEERRPFLVMAAICFLLGVLGWTFYLARAASLKGKISDALQVKVDRMHGFETRLNPVHKETSALDAVATPLLTAIDERNFWLKILEDLNSRLPKQDIWITELLPTSGGTPLSGPGSGPTAATPIAPSPASSSAPGAIDGVLLRGLYLFNPRQQEVVVDYFRNLLDSPFFVIDPTKQSEVIKPSIPTNTEWAYPYELRLKLRRPIPMP
jgi:type IV pilus assembly protein PilM